MFTVSEKGRIDTMNVRALLDEYLDETIVGGRQNLSIEQYNAMATAFVFGIHVVVQGRDADITRQIVEILKECGSLPGNYQTPIERN